MDKYLYLDKEKEKYKQASVMLFGAGTQSIGLLLMALDGIVEIPNDVVFADTGDEPSHVYDYFAMFQDYIDKKYKFKIHTVSRNDKSLSQTIIDYVDGKSNEKPKTLPYRTENGMMRYRQCTDHYKVRPIRKFIKEKYKPNKKSTIEIWFGISYDEMERMKIAPLSWEYNRYPLVEMEMKRIDVINYVKKHGLPEPPRSSCYFCPFHSSRYWNFLKNEHPHDFDKAINLDEKIRNYPGADNKFYLNKNGRIPKALRDFNYTEQAGLFSELIEECGGYCGV